MKKTLKDIDGSYLRTNPKPVEEMTLYELMNAEIKHFEQKFDTEEEMIAADEEWVQGEVAQRLRKILRELL